MIPLNVCEPSVPSSTHNPSMSWYVNHPFGKSAEILKNELKYLGYHKTFIFKRGNKNVLWFQYPGVLLEITKS